MNIVWAMPPQVHPAVGDLEPGQTYTVPDALGAAWCEQGAARPVREAAGRRSTAHVVSAEPAEAGEKREE